MFQQSGIREQTNNFIALEDDDELGKHSLWTGAYVIIVFFRCAIARYFELFFAPSRLCESFAVILPRATRDVGLN